MPAKYELKNDKILKNGHTMFLEDVLSDLKRKSYLESERLKQIEESKVLYSPTDVLNIIENVKRDVLSILGNSNKYKNASMWVAAMNRKENDTSDFNTLSENERLKKILLIQQNNPNWLSARVDAYHEMKEVIKKEFKIAEQLDMTIIENRKRKANQEAYKYLTDGCSINSEFSLSHKEIEKRNRISRQVSHALNISQNY